jgi:aspartate aminotransferase
MSLRADTFKLESKCPEINNVLILFLAYRDENGKPWVLPFVLDVENKLLKSATFNHEYILFLGMDSFKELAPRLILGEKSPALESGRVSISVQ